MKNLGTSFFIVLLITVGYLFFGSWYWPCKVKGLCGNEQQNAVTTSTEPTTPPTPEIQAFSLPFQLNDNGQVLLKDSEGVTFNKDSDIPSYNDRISGKLQEFASLLQNDESKDLVITGIYNQEDKLPEGNTQTNLGLARANQFKAQLAQLGIPTTRMISLYERSDHPNLYDANGILQGGIKLDLINKELGDDGIINPLAEPFYVYFETGSSYVKLDSTLRANITHTIQYLNGVENAQLQLIGHTDSVGDASNNVVLGLNRANDLAKTFADFGLSESQISTSSLGEESPIASNQTEQGRAQNRRVEMRIPNEN